MYKMTNLRHEPEWQIILCFQVRLLMLPYLIINLIGLIVMILGCVGGCVALFFYSPEHVVMGVIASVITLILAILLIYFWSVVQRAFVELGNDDRMYR